MKEPIKDNSPKVIEPPYFSNWADQFFPKIANKTLPFAMKIPGLTPNIVTLISFILYALGSIFLFVEFPLHLLATAILLPISYILDCLDGQLARATKKYSSIGGYFDKTSDFLKIFIINASLGYAVYLQTDNILYVWLGFISAYAFAFRYYIKYLVIVDEEIKDNQYFIKSNEKRKELFIKIKNDRDEMSKTFTGKIKRFWYTHRSILYIEEAEFVVFVSIAALFNQLQLMMWILAIGQIGVTTFRLLERGYQITSNREKLLEPVGK